MGLGQTLRRSHYFVRATCKIRGDGDSKESEQSIKTKYNSKKLEKQVGSSNNEIKSVY